MDPQSRFCHNPDCAERGVVGVGNIRIPQSGGPAVPVSAVPARPSAETTDTPFYRLHRPASMAVLVLDAAEPWLPDAGDRRRVRAR